MVCNYFLTIVHFFLQVLEATCSIDITFFPFDKQTCELKFIAWSYTKADVNLNIGNKGIILNDYDPNSQWDIMSTSTKDTNSYESSITFSLTLKRKPSFYIMNIIFPVILLSILNCFTFVLPVMSGERASYAITVFLSLAVFLTIVASQLPKNSDKTSWLAVYLMTMTTLSTLIVLICLIEVRLSTRTPEEEPLSRPYYFLYKISQVLRCKTRKQKRVCNLNPYEDEKLKCNGASITELENDTSGLDKSHQGIDGKQITPHEHITWLCVVNAIDFFAFWISILITFVFTVIFFVVTSSST